MLVLPIQPKRATELIIATDAGSPPIRGQAAGAQETVRLGRSHTLRTYERTATDVLAFRFERLKTPSKGRFALDSHSPAVNEQKEQAGGGQLPAHVPQLPGFLAAIPGFKLFPSRCIRGHSYFALSSRAFGRVQERTRRRAHGAVDALRFRTERRTRRVRNGCVAGNVQEVLLGRWSSVSGIHIYTCI